MQCPVCKKHTMGPRDLDADFSCMACAECSGLCITRAGYDAWRARQLAELPEISSDARVEVIETHKAKLCPQCGRLMLPYRVGHGLAFSIDYCSACGGIWLDGNEWEAIKARNLHDKLHEIIARFNQPLNCEPMNREPGVVTNKERLPTRPVMSYY